MTIVVSAFYAFAPVADPGAFRDSIAAAAAAHGVRGGVLVASEGVNGTIAGDDVGVAAVLAHIRAAPGFEAMPDRPAVTTSMPFVRLKVELKPEIVTFHQPGIDPTQRVGRYVSPSEWNELLAKNDVVVVDTRNDFEVQLGTFRGALNPQTTAFTEFPRFVDETLATQKHKTVAMFCTGGIRCEKATAYLLQQGFSDVVHLQGGILRYLAEVNEADSRFDGRCFVFDARVSVGHGLVPGGARGVVHHHLDGVSGGEHARAVGDGQGEGARALEQDLLELEGRVARVLHGEHLLGRGQAAHPAEV